MIEIRRIFTHVEDIHHEFGPVAVEERRAAPEFLDPPRGAGWAQPGPGGARMPLRRGAVAVVITNPFAGRYEPELMPMMEALNPLGLAMARRLREAMDVPVERVEGYGKGAIVGAAGELEHGALWHVPGGYAMRELLGWKGERASYAKGQAAGTKGQPGNALAIVPSTKKVGGPGSTLDVPMTHINASYVRSHFDAIEVRVPGAPLADELVYVLAMSTGARVHARVGGLKAADIASWDGQR